MRGLYAITPDEADSSRLTALVGAALAGGVPVLQYRNKCADAAQRLREARTLRALCREARTTFIVNDDVQLALDVDADGVHIGRDDGDPASARMRLGGRLIGVSCYDSLRAAEAAVAAGADYVAFGSVFASPTKPGAVRAPLDLFPRARALGVPLVGIGGITLANAPALLDAGADCAAVISDLFAAADVAGRARAFAELFSLRKTNT